MKNKTTLITGISITSVCLVYNIILFVLVGFEDKNNSFWASYGFLMLAFLLCIIINCGLFANKNTVQYWFLGFPALRWSAIYLVVAFVISTLFMVINSVKFCVVIHLILLLFYGGFIMACYFQKEHIVNLEQSNSNKSYPIREMKSDLDWMASSCVDSELRKSLQKLCDEFRYSDPVSSESLVEVEGYLRADINLLANSIRINDGTAISIIMRLHENLALRNARCRASK